MSEVFSSEIQFFGQKAILACDAQCHKAFGINARQTSPNSLDEDDFEYLADDELGEAPKVTGNTEGGHDKPRDLLEAHNKWCARECERSVLVKLGEAVVLRDFSQRVQNIPK